MIKTAKQIVLSALRAQVPELAGDEDLVARMVKGVERAKDPEAYAKTSAYRAVISLRRRRQVMLRQARRNAERIAYEDKLTQAQQRDQELMTSLRREAEAIIMRNPNLSDIVRAALARHWDGSPYPTDPRDRTLMYQRVRRGLLALHAHGSLAMREWVRTLRTVPTRRG